LGEEIPGMDGYENSYKYMEPDPSSLDSKAHHTPYAEGSLSCAFRPPETDNFMGGAGAGGCRQKKKQEAVEDLVGAAYPLEEGLTATEAAAAARACHVPSLKLNYKEVLSACSDQSLWTAHDKHPQIVPVDPNADAAVSIHMFFIAVCNLFFFSLLQDTTWYSGLNIVSAAGSWGCELPFLQLTWVLSIHMLS
jgi:hypothetical protein